MKKLPIEISDEMVSVGTRVLRESGYVEHESSVDPLVVREILEKALAAHKATHRRCKAGSSGRQTPA